VKITSWNIARSDECWRELARSEADVALIQEASAPPTDIVGQVGVEELPWLTAGSKHRPWRTSVARLREDLGLKRITTVPLGTDASQWGVSCPGTLAGAVLDRRDAEPLTVISAYATWEDPHASTASSWIYSDAAAHRLVSDIAALVGRQSGHRILVAGDFNILHGYGEDGSLYWAKRYQTVFDRMEAMGLHMIGPQAPHGRQAAPWPRELPSKSRNVPTYHSTSQTPATATRQLDFVFASTALREQVSVTARNTPDEWGPSDHCRIDITIA
jgi:exonuclease III